MMLSECTSHFPKVVKVIPGGLLILALIGFGFLSGCTDEGAVDPGGPGGPPALIVYADDIQPIWNNNCAACHLGGNQQGGLDLSASVSHGNLVDVESPQFPGAIRVIAEDSGASLLYQKLTGTQTNGQRMPLGGQLSAQDQELVRRWIDEGAEGASDPPENQDPVVYETDIQPIWNADCTSCHTIGSNTGGLNLSEGVSHANLVGVASVQFAAATRIIAGDPANSLLYQKMMDMQSNGDHMPPTGLVSMEKRELVRRWIAEGAVGPVNPPPPPDPVAYADDIQPIWNANCAGCHTDGGQNGGLDLSSGLSHGNLVGVESAQFIGAIRVIAANSFNSLLYQKLTGTQGVARGNHMPPTGLISPETRELVRRWIEEGAAAPPPPIPDPVSYATEIQPIFNANCAGCHTDGGQNGGLDLSSGLSHGNLVGVESAQFAGVFRVIAEQPDNSLLYQKLTATQTNGSMMPPTGLIAEADRELVRTWIAEGANDN